MVLTMRALREQDYDEMAARCRRFLTAGQDADGPSSSRHVSSMPPDRASRSAANTMTFPGMMEARKAGGQRDMTTSRAARDSVVIKSSRLGPQLGERNRRLRFAER